MVEMCMGKQEQVDRARIKAEIFGIFLIEFVATLKHAAVDEYPLTLGLEQVTGASNVTVSAVEGEFHGIILLLWWAFLRQV